MGSTESRSPSFKPPLRFTEHWDLACWSSMYRECLLFELQARGLKVAVEGRIPISYKGKPLNGQYRIDLLVADAVIVELKSIDALLPVHGAQVLTYLRLTDKRVGLLINFNVSYFDQRRATDRQRSFDGLPSSKSSSGRRHKTANSNASNPDRRSLASLRFGVGVRDRQAIFPFPACTPASAAAPRRGSSSGRPRWDTQPDRVSRPCGRDRQWRRPRANRRRGAGQPTRG